MKGWSRFRILECEITEHGLLVAHTEAVDDDANQASAALVVCATFLAKIIARREANLHQDHLRFDDAFCVGMRLTELLPLSNAIKQKMLELTDATMRLEVLQRFLVDQGLVATK